MDLKRDGVLAVKILAVVAIVVLLAPSFGQGKPGPAGNIDGYVRDTSGAPIAEATVQTYDCDGNPQKWGITDSSGYYLILRVGLAGNPYTMTASKYGYYDQTVENVVVPYGDYVHVDFALQPMPPVGNVDGYVYDGGTYLPLLNAQVTLSLGSTTYSAYSNSYGYFNVQSVYPGTYALTASCSGYEAYSLLSPVTVVSYETTRVSEIYMAKVTRTLQTPLALASVAWDSLNSRAVICGGQTSGGAYLDEIVIYDPATDTNTVAPTTLPSARDSTSSAWYGGTKNTVYIFGGRTGDTAGTRDIVKFVPATGTVTRLTNALQYGLWGTSAVTAGNYIYIFGGMYKVGTSPVTYSNNIYRFNPADDSVTTLTTKLPSARAYTSAAYDGSQYIYIFGGQISSIGYTSQILKFTPATNAIAPLADPLPSQRAYTAAAYDGNNVYVYGGRNSDGTVTDQALRVNKVTGTVDLMLRDMQYATYGHAGVGDGYTSFLFGGFTKAATLESILRYHDYSNGGNLGAEPYNIFIGGMVNAANGNLVLSDSDISLQTRAFSVNFERTYNGLSYNKLGPMGYGWTHSYNMSAREQRWGDVLLTEACGSQHLFLKDPDGSYVTPPGMTSRLTKDFATGGYILWSLDGTRTMFGSSMKLSSIVDKNGNTLTFTYDAESKLINITDGTGVYLKISYNSDKLINRVTDTEGNSIYYVYGTVGTPTYKCLLEVGHQTPLSPKVEYNYKTSDGSKRLEYVWHYVKDKMYLSAPMLVDDQTSFVYDAQGRVSQVWKAEVIDEWKPNVELYPRFMQYLMNYTNARETWAKCVLDKYMGVKMMAEGLPIRVMGAPMAGSAGGCGGGGSSLFPGNPGNEEIFLTWTEEYMLSTYSDALLHTYEYTYDAYGNLLWVMNPMWYFTSNEWKVIDTRTQYIALLMNETNELTKRTQYLYDAKGNNVKMIDPLGYYISTTYDQYGNVLSTRDKRGFYTTYTYDSHGFLTRITDPTGAVITYTNDDVGQVVEVTTPLGYSTNYTYLFGEVINTTLPSGTYLRLDRDYQGEVVIEYDAMGNNITYDVNVTLRSSDVVTDQLDHSTKYYYNAMGFLLKVVDAKNHAYTFTYDYYGRLKTMTMPLGQVYELWYDRAGNVVKRLDANGNETDYVYDSLNRLKETSYPNGEKIVWTYDATGNILNITGPSPDIWKATKYDDLGRPIEITTHYVYEGYYVYFNREFKELISYDGNWNPVSCTITDVTSSETVYDVDYYWTPRNQLSEITTDATGPHWKFFYDKDGRRTYKWASDDTIGPWYNTSYVYDEMGRTTGISVATNGPLSLSGYAYTYDDAGRIITATDSGGTTTYEYDKVSQLVGYVMPDGDYVDYTYDPVGNRAKEVSYIDGVQTTVNYAYDANDRLMTAGLDSFQYDENGNLVYKNLYSSGYYYDTTYSYDYENRLVSVDDGYRETNNYSGDGELLVSYQYFKKGAYLDFLHVYTHVGALSTRASFRAMNGYDGSYRDGTALYNVPGTDEHLGYRGYYASLFFGGMSFAIVDAMGNTRALVEGADTYASADLMDYLPFGEMVQGSLSILDVWSVCPSFQGRYYDWWSEMYDFRARHYDASTGRFAQTDPQPSYGASPYAFVGNDPLNSRDPTGMMKVECIVAWIKFGMGIALSIVGISLMKFKQGSKQMKKLDQFITDFRKTNKAMNLISDLKNQKWGNVFVSLFKIAYEFTFKWYMKTLSLWDAAKFAGKAALRFGLWYTTIVNLVIDLVSGMYFLKKQGCW